MSADEARLADVERVVRQLAAENAELRRRLDNAVRHGPVTHVDAAKQLMRIRVGGTEAEPMLSPWLPWAQVAGALKVRWLPSVGQNMTVFAPTGDFRQAVTMPFTWSDSFAAPTSAEGEQMIVFGEKRITLREDFCRIAHGEGAEAPRAVVTDEYAKIRRGENFVVVTETDILVSKLPVVGEDPEPDV